MEGDDDEEEGGAGEQEDCNDATDVDDAALMNAGAGASGHRWSPRVWSCTKLTKAPVTCRYSRLFARNISPVISFKVFCSSEIALTKHK